jgi:hypothetical protein
MAVVEPYLPAGHRPAHMEVVDPAALLKRPCGHCRQVACPWTTEVVMGEAQKQGVLNTPTPPQSVLVEEEPPPTAVEQKPLAV